MPEDPKYPIININGDSEVEFKGYGRNINGTPPGGVSITQFKNKLDAVLSSEDIKTQFAGKVFFEIILRVDYSSEYPQELFRKLGVVVRSVFPTDEGNLRKVIVSGPSDTIRQYKQQTRINQNYLKCVEDIRQISSESKIGPSIREKWANNNELAVEVSLLNKISGEELSELNEKFQSLMRKVKMGTHTATASGILSKIEIKQLSDIPLVKYISAKTKWVASNILRGSSLESPFKIQSEQTLERLPKVCIIDTGFGRGLQNHCIECTSINNLPSDDIDGHGTNVASLCMFGKESLLQDNHGKPSIGIISHKISEKSENDQINFFDELINAMEKHKEKTKVFCFSWNAAFYDKVTYEDRLKQLDEYLQKNNLLLINSCGNIEREHVRQLYPKYPEYITEHNVLSPSETKYTFAVGATHFQGKNILSSFTRAILPMTAINKIEERTERIKPEVYAEGGFIIPGKTAANDVDKGIMSLSTTGHRQYVLGTSVSAPQVARSAALLMEKYKIKNVETIKSLLFLKSELFIQENGSFKHAGRTLINDTLILDADDGFYFIFEEETSPHERVEEMKKNKIFGHRWKFPVPKEIEFVEIAICQSNNNPNEDCLKMSTRIVTSIHKPGVSGPLNKNFLDGYGTLGAWAPLVFGRYNFTQRTEEGLWDLYAYVKTRGIPSSQLSSIKIRIGAAVKIKIKEEYISDKDRIYAKILDMLGLDSSAYISSEIEGTIEIPSELSTT